MRWHTRHGRWWMVQWGRPIWFSLGIHIDCHLRYVDVHLGFLILTLGSPDYSFEEYHTWWSARSL